VSQDNCADKRARPMGFPSGQMPWDVGQAGARRVPIPPAYTNLLPLMASALAAQINTAPQRVPITLPAFSPRRLPPRIYHPTPPRTTLQRRERLLGSGVTTRLCRTSYHSLLTTQPAWRVSRFTATTDTGAAHTKLLTARTRRCGCLTANLSLVVAERPTGGKKWRRNSLMG